MYLNVADRNWVIQQLKGLNVHDDECRRLADLGECPETIGHEIVSALNRGDVAMCLTPDMDFPAFLTTDSSMPAAIARERAVALGIGQVGGPSRYDRLFVGGTIFDAPLDPEVVHVNTMP